jgi:transcriptional regulator with XRE-family HTH domain
MTRRKKVRIVNHLTAKELADLIGVSVTEVIKSLFPKRIMRTVHKIFELETARALAIDTGCQLTDDEDPPDEHAAAVPKKPIIPQDGEQMALPEPEPEPNSEQDT